ncbi:MAG: FAD binding domain-containing protein [Spirochaetia bacterium]|nr:FAD binding domain-containing protein [Spirochaetia bacterium]
MVDAYRPQSLEEALLLRSETGAIPFAGGTDLMVKYRYESGAVPEYPGPILFLPQLKELRGIRVSEEEIRIGAGSTLSEILHSPQVPELLKEAVRTIAAPGLRNTATLGGNICNASPAADGVCALYALNARARVASAGSERELPLYDFITGPGKTILGEDELLVAIILPMEQLSLHLFRKVGTRRANALAKLNIAATAKLRGDRVDEVRIALGAVAPVVLRSLELEKQMAGLTKTELSKKLEYFVEGYEAMIRPIDDQRSTAEYRGKVSVKLLRQFLSSLIDA